MRIESMMLSALAVWLALSSTAAAREEPLQMGVAAMISPKETPKHYRSLLFLVDSKIGRRAELVQRPTHGAFGALPKGEEIRVAFVGAGPCVKNKAAFDVEHADEDRREVPPFGIPPVDLPQNIDPALKQQLRRAFVALASDPEGEETLSRTRGDRFVLPDDANNESIGDMESWLEEFNQ